MDEQTAGAAGGPLVLVVPNFSEGRRVEVMDAIVDAMTAVAGITLLNRQSDPDHNRLDVTLIGAPPAARAAALAGAARAVELIDMDAHHGGHPRMGAVDVIPFIPVRGTTMDECVALARGVARELADSLSLPVYLYERAAISPERASLADVRRGEYEGLKADVAQGRRLPDFGPHVIGRAGATAVGARPPLVAFNVYLSGTDEAAAKDVARRVRERSGGLVNVRAVGFAVAERGCVEVSMNLIDPLTTPPYRALELVRLEAARRGMHVLDTEIVGLTPQAVLDECAGHYLQLRGFDPDEQVIETLVARQASGGTAAPAGSLRGLTVEGFLHALGSNAPTPGGGAAAAVSGAAGAALVAMVGRLTVGKQGYEAVAERMGTMAAEADAARAALLELAERDSAAFEAVMDGYRMPRGSDEEKAARSAAIQVALHSAADVPLEVARRSASLLPLAREAIERGNENASSDGLAAAQSLHAAVQIALANVTINLGSMKDAERVKALRSESARLRADAVAQLAQADAAFAARVPA
jgi:glutamate formiminotransferase/formiminotetrahydrofolate cyclodeaminase